MCRAQRAQPPSRAQHSFGACLRRGAFFQLLRPFRDASKAAQDPSLVLAAGLDRGQIKNDDSADDVKNVDLTQVIS